MNHFTLGAAALLVSSTLFAQPVLQGSDVNPTVGESFTMYTSDYISPGAGGANATWDLSAMNNGGSTQTVYSAASGSFPGTNITASYGGGASMAYLNLNSTGFFYHGMAASGVTFTYAAPSDNTNQPSWRFHAPSIYATGKSVWPAE